MTSDEWVLNGIVVPNRHPFVPRSSYFVPLTEAFVGPQGGADDAGVVAEAGGHDARVGLEVLFEAFGLVADAAADDDEVGGEDELEVREIFVDPVGPFLPGQFVAFAGAVGGVEFGFGAVEFKTALPMPVPNVSRMTTPSSFLPAP